MSHNIWYNYHPLTGSEYPSSSTGANAPSHIPSMARVSHFVQKTHGSSDPTTRPHQYLTHPRFHFAVREDTLGAADVVTYYHDEPRIHETRALIPEFNMKVLHPYYSMNGVAEHLNVKDQSSSVVVPSCFSPTMSFQCHDHQQAPPSSPTLLYLEDSPESPPVVTPKLEDPENFCLDSSSLALSPYAPMPLPPIFTHESGSKVTPILIDTISSSPFWTAHEKQHREERCVPIDPFLDPSIQDLSLETRNPFARESAAVGAVWTSAPLAPAFSAPAHVQVDYSMFSEVSEHPKDIPLDIAQREAAAFRAAGANVSLSPHFLMQFLGQPAGQTKWHCYIHGCGKKLTRKGHMMDHVRMHLDERSFACEHCSQTFLRKADCKRHAATHNPTKGFPCDSCPKSYARKDLLTRHARICASKAEDAFEVPAMNRNRQKKRKGIPLSGVVNSQSANGTDLAFVAPDVFLLPQGCHKGDERLNYWGYDEDNKENIDPSTFPSGPMFSARPEWSGDYGDSECKRKKARTRV